jgi:hypothetical protein
VISISVKHNIDEVMLSLRNTHVKTNQAAAWAINETLVKAKDETVAEMRRVFQAPTPWTLNSMRVRRAGPNKLEGTIYFRDEAGKGTPAAKYIQHQIAGGSRQMKRFERALRALLVLPDGYVAVPGDAAVIDAYGNMSVGQIKQILSYFNASEMKSGYTANTTAAKRERMRRGTKTKRGIEYFVGRPGNGRLPFGIYQRITQFARHGDSASAIKPLLIFLKGAHYQRRLDFNGVIDRAIAKHWNVEFRRALTQYKT